MVKCRKNYAIALSKSTIRAINQAQATLSEKSDRDDDDRNQDAYKGCKKQIIRYGFELSFAIRAFGSDRNERKHA